MSSTTPLLGLVYPAPGDSADVSYWLQQLAQTVEANFGAWTAYTPTLTAATTNPSLGTGGNAAGRYRKIGKTVHAVGQVQFGSSGASFGAGQYFLSLPVPPNGSLTSIAGHLGVNPNAGTVWASCLPFINVGGGNLYFWGPTSTTSPALNPVSSSGVLGTAMTASGLFRWDLTYEAA